MKYYKELPNGYKEVYSIDVGITKGLILNLLGLTIMIVMLVILMISLPVIFFHTCCLLCLEIYMFPFC